MELIGHRGYPALYPENTIKGFLEAVEEGCTGIELDARLTGDNRAVVIHDRDVGRTTSGKGMVSGYSFQALKRLDAGRGEKIPGLEEVFAAIPPDIKIIVEIKEDTSSRIEVLCAECTQTAGDRKNVLFASFDLAILSRIRKINAGLKTALIVAGQIDLNTNPNNIIDSICFHKDVLDDGIVSLAEKMRLLIYIWPVDKKEDVRRAVNLGATGIITNNPGKVRKLL